MMAGTSNQRVKKAISHFVTGLMGVRRTITGSDLIEIGIQPGPIFREIFNAVTNARLDGKIKTRSHELALAQAYWKARWPKDKPFVDEKGENTRES